MATKFEEVEGKGSIFLFCICCQAIGYLICAILIYVAAMKTQTDYHAYPTAFMNEVVTNWEMIPFVSINVPNATVCPDDHPVNIFNRTWYGVNEGCDCTG